MWRYYVISMTEVLYRTDSLKEARNKVRTLVWERGTGKGALLIVRGVSRHFLQAVDKAYAE